MFPQPDSFFHLYKEIMYLFPYSRTSIFYVWHAVYDNHLLRLYFFASISPLKINTEIFFRGSGNYKVVYIFAFNLLCIVTTSGLDR